MDRKQVREIVHYMIGEKPIGVDGNGDEIGVPYAPELRAFVIARLGDDTPAYGNAVTIDGHRSRAPFAAFLRELADAIDPPVTP